MSGQFLNLAFGVVVALIPAAVAWMLLRLMVPKGLARYVAAALVWLVAYIVFVNAIVYSPRVTVSGNHHAPPPAAGEAFQPAGDLLFSTPEQDAALDAEREAMEAHQARGTQP